MKKLTKLTLSFLMVFVVLFSIVVPASAATGSPVTYSTSNYGGDKAITFYVNAKSKSTTKIRYTCTTGHFITNMGSFREHEGYFTVEISGRNSNKESWTNVKKVNIKNVTSKTLPMKGYTQYKIRVWSWKTSTIGANIGGVCNSINASWCDWAGKKLPTCTFTAYSNVKSITK